MIGKLILGLVTYGFVMPLTFMAVCWVKFCKWVWEGLPTVIGFAVFFVVFYGAIKLAQMV